MLEAAVLFLQISGNATQPAAPGYVSKKFDFFDMFVRNVEVFDILYVL